MTSGILHDFWVKIDPKSPLYKEEEEEEEEEEMSDG